jgi:hypothetical protein
VYSRGPVASDTFGSLHAIASAAIGTQSHPRIGNTLSQGAHVGKMLRSRKGMTAQSR